MNAPPARRTGLTPRQNACLQAIKSHFVETGVMPNTPELQAVLGMASRGGVHRLLVQLETRGAIKRTAHRARGIRLTQSICPHCGGELP